MNYARNGFLLMAQLLMVTLLASTAIAQHGTWTESSEPLTRAVLPYAGPGFYYAEDIFIRSGQQDLYFVVQPGISTRMEVKVNNGPWEVINNNTPKGLVKWNNVPTAPGSYDLYLKDYDEAAVLHEITYELFVLPDAQRAFKDNYGNTIVSWNGSGIEGGLAHETGGVDGQAG